MKLEDCLNKLRDETNSSDISKLPSLILPTSELESLQIPTVQTHPAIGSDVTRCLHRNRPSFNAYRNSEPNTATTQDLSEDEQINYYDDEDIEDDDHVQDCTIDSKTNDSVSKNSNSLNLKPNSSDADDESEGRQLTEENQNNSDEDEDEEEEDEEEDSDEPDLDDEDAEDAEEEGEEEEAFHYTDGLGKAVTSVIESGIKTVSHVCIHII